MRIKFYLDEKSRKKAVLRILEAKRKEESDPNRFMFHHNEGSTYFNADEEGIYTSSESFFGGVPRRVAAFPIRLITLYDEVLETRLTEGEYKNDKAVALVDHFSRKAGHGWDEKHEQVWRILIRSKDLVDAERLYRDIRTRRLKPSEAWSHIMPPLEQPLLEITSADIQQSEEGDSQETMSA